MKRLIIASALILAAFSASAKDDAQVVVNPFNKNWELSLGIGTSAYVGEYSLTDFNFTDWWSFPAIDLNLNKWISPYFGLGFGVTASQFKGLYSGDATMSTFNYDSNLYENTHYSLQKGFYLNAMFKGYMDLTNVFGGYKERNYNLIGYLGGGFAFPVSNVNYGTVDPTFNAGLVNRFKLGKNLDLDVTVRGAFVSDQFNGTSFYTCGAENFPVDMVLGATAGINWSFGKVGKNNDADWVTVEDAALASAAYAAAVKAAEKDKARADKAESELEKAKAQIKDQAQKLKTAGSKKYEAPVSYNSIIAFSIDKAEISNKEMINVLLAGSIMKKAPDTKFKLTGYADKQTGSAAYNQKLSEKRVAAVKKALVEKYGVNPDQIITEAKGGVDYMYFNDKKCSRIVTIESIAK